MSDRAAPKVKKTKWRRRRGFRKVPGTLQERVRQEHLDRLARETVADRKNKIRAQIDAGDMSAVTRVLNAACAFKSQYQISRARARSIDGAMEAATQLTLF